MVLLVDIVFPLFGCLMIAMGVLVGIFSERWTNFWNKSNWSLRTSTPELTRGFAAFLALFGLIFLAFSSAPFCLVAHISYDMEIARRWQSGSV